MELVVYFDDRDPVGTRKGDKSFPSCRIFPTWLELLRKKIRSKCYTKLGNYETYFHIKYKNHEKKNCLLLVFLRPGLLLNSEL